MEQGNLYLIRNFSATRSKITIDATTSASEDLSLSLSLSLHTFTKTYQKKNCLGIYFSLFLIICYPKK
jgi:hypothetical protein